MNTFETFSRMSGVIIAAACTTMMLATVPVQAQDEVDEIRVVEKEMISDQDHGGKEKRNVTVKIENDDIHVEIDGKVIPDDQIRREGRRVVIVDENGDEIEVIELGRGGRGRARSFVFSGDEPIGRQQYADEFRFASGREPKVMLGIHMTRPEPGIVHHLGLEKDTTTMITGVFEGLPAHSAGLGEFDIITKINGKSPATQEQIVEALKEKSAGDTIKLTVIQKGKSKDVTLTLAEFDRETMREAKLLGSAPEQNFWQAYQMGDMGRGPQGFEFRMPDQPRVFVAPEFDRLRERTGMMAPEMEMRVRERLREAGQGREGLEKQLQKLNERLAELETKLGKLLEEGS